MTRERLEALPFESLKKVAEQEGIDVPDDVEKILLIDLLLEIYEDKKQDRESRNNNPVRIQQKKYDVSFSEDFGLAENSGDCGLPERYNAMRVVMMLRDPYWAFVYWDVKGESLRAMKKEYEADTALLRVLRLRSGTADAAPGSVLEAYDIPLGPDDSSWYVNIPEQDSFYCVELVFQGRNAEKVIGRSNTIRVPRGVTREDLALKDGTPLDTILSLSGVENLDVFAPKKTIPQRISTLHEDGFL
jgi:hypothetical protein